MEENKSLKTRKNLVGRNNLYNIKNTDGKIAINKRDITQIIEAFYNQLYSTADKTAKSFKRF